MQELSQEGAEASWKWGEAPDKRVSRTFDPGRLERQQIAGLWSHRMNQ